MQHLNQAQVELDRADYELLRIMRARGLTWPQIGGELGTSWQAAHQRFQRHKRRFGNDPLPEDADEADEASPPANGD